MEDEKEQVSQIIYGCCYLMTQNLLFHGEIFFFLRLLNTKNWSEIYLWLEGFFFFFLFFWLGDYFKAIFTKQG